SQIVDMSGLQDGNGIYSGNGSLSGNTTVTQGASNLIYNLNNSGDFQVRDNNTALFSVSNLGGIGIKTHSPTRELDVNGDVRLRGRIFDENNQAGSTGEVLTRTGTGVDWQAPPAGSDDQNLSVGAGTATTSVIEMEDGNDITLIEGPNIQLTENTTNGEITIEAIGDGTGTDNQNLSVGAGTASTSIIEMENGNDITLIEGPNIQLTENTTNGEITIEAIGDGTGTDNQNLSVGTGTPTTSVIEVENGDDITLIAGTNVSLSENTTNREITINSSGADNLGNHTATTDLDMGNNDIQLGLNSNITIAGAPGNNGWRLTTDGTSVYWGAPTGFDGNGIYSGSGTLTSTSHVTCSGGSLTFGTSGSVGVRIGASGIVAGSVAGLSTAPISIADVGNAVLEIDASGAGTTFDARIELSNDGTPEWTLGFDDSDGDKFKIGQATINNNTALTINSSGNMGIGTTNPSEKLEVSGIVKSQGVEAGSMRINRQAVASIIYTITSSDYYIGLTSTSVAFVTVNLPAAAAIGSGQVFIIKDEAGGAGAFNVTIDGNGTETIDGALTKSISTNYGVVKLICDGNNWFTTL
ncbi:MAG: hypothetical protein MRY83_00160, partial [Flavobacteriales bacterium]|nr:hypothetical protein [Flavobacteriales bacterium]